MGNPLAHFDGTAAELLEQTDGKIDMIVIGTGTGGTISGIARRLKQELPDVVVVGVDPVGSLLAKGVYNDGSETEDREQTYQVEGTGYDFVPAVCDRGIVDDWVKTEDGPSLVTARELIRSEGLLCGGSSGATTWAAMQAVRGQTLLGKVKPLRAGQRCVILLPDSTRNYMTKFLSDDWMIQQELMQPQSPEQLRLLEKNDPIAAAAAAALANGSSRRGKSGGSSMAPAAA